MEQNPIKTGSNGELAVWLCQYHNYVNEKLDKDGTICADVGKLWGKDDCGCDIVDDEVDSKEKSKAGKVA